MKADVATIAHWIQERQYGNAGMPSFGGIRVHSTPGATGTNGTLYYRVSPYLGNLAVLGLLESREPFALLVTERWITWYLAHLNATSAPDGVPYEHFYLADGSGETTCVLPGVPPGDKNADPHLCHYNDATDSAAALFFRVLWAYDVAGGKQDFLTVAGRKAEIDRLGTVLLALQQPDGLCWAKRDYRAKYLEDNSEVYDGLRALAQLEEKIYGDVQRSQLFSVAADRVRQGILKELYDPITKRYYVAKFEDGKRLAPDLNHWYPDMQSQMWPHLWGVVDSKDPRTAVTVAALNSIWSGGNPSHPGWASAPNRVNGGWINADVAYAALIGGEKDRITTYLHAVKSLKFPDTAQSSPFPWPFTIGDAGWLLKIYSKR